MSLRLEEVPCGSEPDASDESPIEQTLAILGGIRRAALTARDVVSALDAVVDAVARGCGDVPSAILLAEGEPPGLVLASTACLPRHLHRVLHPLAHPGHPLTVNVLAGRWWEPVTLCGLELYRLAGPEGAVGLLAIASAPAGPGGGDGSPLRSEVAEQVALAVSHALARSRAVDLQAEIRLADRRLRAQRKARGRLEG